MRCLLLATTLSLAAGAPLQAPAQQDYAPSRGDWERRPAEAVGMRTAGLDSAVAFAQANEIDWLRDMQAQITRQVSTEPYPAILGPTKDWAGTSGLIVRRGYIVAEWGDTKRVDMTFSVAKSYLSTVAGLAFDRGMIPDLQQPVRNLVHDGGFDSPHNATITWHNLLQQTSEWEGTLWGKPDVADRRAGRDRELRAPGTFWEYNDVRVNRTALALLRVWQRPLPEVLREYVMDPIGASDTWRWYGYYNAYARVGGRWVASVSGGSHWGGGFWASTRDHARYGLLMLRRGVWNGRRLLSERWIDLATTSSEQNPQYGYMWWLNQPDRQPYPPASAGTVLARGSGGNTIWIEPEDDLVVVVRWMDPRRNVTTEFMRLVRNAVIH